MRKKRCSSQEYKVSLTLKNQSLQIAIKKFFCQLFFFYINLFFCCVGSSLLRAGFLFVVVRTGATLPCGAWASHCSGFSLLWSTGSRCAGFQQLWLADSRAQAQQLWRTDLVASRHVGSSRTRARTHVPCISRLILNHCTTREVLVIFLLIFLFLDASSYVLTSGISRQLHCFYHFIKKNQINFSWFISLPIMPCSKEPH